MSDPVRHDPTFFSGGGSRWVTCTCGWSATHVRNHIGAQLAFGEHLLDAARGTRIVDHT